MQSRRREEHVAVSPASRAQQRIQVGPEPYRRTRRDGSDRETVHQRNLSPQKIDELRRGVGGNNGSDGFERRDHDWHLGSGRSSQVRSRSPPIEQPRKRPQFDDGIRRRSCSPPLGMRPRFEISKTMEFNVDGENLDAQRVYGYDYVNCRVNREKDLTESRLGGGQGMLDPKLMEHESEVRGSYRLVPDTALPSHYEESGGPLPKLSRSADVGRFEHERLQHRDLLPSDKIPVTESYKGVEKTVLHPREVSVTTMSPSYTKDFASTSQMRDYGSSSLGMSRSDICSHHDDNHLTTYYELPRGSGKLTEPVGFSGYEQRPLKDTTRVPEPGLRNMCHQGCAYSPMRTEHEEYLNSKLQVAAEEDERVCQYDDLRRRIAPHGRLDCEQAQMEYNNRELPRTFIMHPVLDRTGKGEDSYGNKRRGSTNDHPALEKPKYFDYPDMSRTSIVTEQGEDYFDSGYNHLEIDRRMPQEYEDSYLGVSEADRLSILRSEYDSRGNRGSGLQQERFQNNHRGSGLQQERFQNNHNRGSGLQQGRFQNNHRGFGLQQERFQNNHRGSGLQQERFQNNHRGSGLQQERFQNIHRGSGLQQERFQNIHRGSGLQQERFQSNPLTKHNLETHRHAARVQDMKQDLGIHDHLDRQLKRKYNADEGMYVCDSRTINSCKWEALEEFQDPYESEEWIDDDETNLLYTTDNVEHDHKFYRKDKREYNGLVREDFASGDWISSQDSMGYEQQHTFRSRKYSGQYVKNHPKSNSSNWNKPQHFPKRNAFHKQPKVWKKNQGYDENMHINNDESCEEWITTTESEPSEGSEEFNQMVQEAFLMYSKRLNVSSSVQRRYKEQGKAGSLFCIVCGRSSSKEFMDTQRLVTHAFMSHKAGLRAKHLGLHKAICVLLGWDTVVPQETITWYPQVLTNAEALAQKEDLILWPPVVIIHNASMSDDNPQKWKVVSMETVEAFLRGKGFVRGRIKVSLGKPADQSVILVKFLGTFGGLGDAERLNKYLSDAKRGRVEFERIKSKTEECSAMDETEVQGDEVESILYGYMGISEDFDKLDFNAKNRCIIKSRKEIEQLDKDPVKASERH